MEVSMRRVCICAATAVAILGEAWASPESDAVRQFGLPGWWLVDCTKPVSMSNPAMAFAAPELSPPFVMFKPIGGMVVMRDARIIAPNRLAYTDYSMFGGKFGGIVMELFKRDGRLVVDKITVKNTSEVLVKDGKDLKHGDRGNLFEPCQAKQSAFPHSTLGPQA
jgi:hypothetical protein